MDLTKLKPKLEEKPPRLVLYGPEKVGKSTFASQAPDVVFMDIEDGLTGIKTAKQKIGSWAEVIDMITALHEQDHGFTTLAVDSLDWLERLIHKAVAKTEGKDDIEDIGYGKGYKLALSYWEQFLNGMNSLRDNKGMTIILLAHDQVKRHDSPITESYDRHEIKLHTAAGAKVVEWADAILFAAPKIHITKEKGKFNQEKTRAIGRGNVIYTRASPAYQAGCRASLKLPDEIELDWNEFINNLNTKED